MTRPRQRPMSDYLSALAEIRDVLWSEHDPETGEAILNPEKVWMVSSIEAVAAALGRVGLRPGSRMKYRSLQFAPARALVVTDGRKLRTARDHGIQFFIGKANEIPRMFQDLLPRLSDCTPGGAASQIVRGRG